MSIDLASQIRSIADEAFVQTTAVNLDRSSDVDASRNRHRLASEEILMLSPRDDASQRMGSRARVLATAAAVVVVIAGVITIALSRDGSDPARLDQPTPPTSVSAASTTAPVDMSALAAIGERLITALDNDDPDTVAELVADDAQPISMFGAATKTELLDLFGWIDASDWRFELQECEGREPDQAQCRVLQSNAWATAAGADAVEGTMFVTIDDGQVVAMRYGFDNSFTQYFEDFYNFVRQADPDAAAQMWATESDGRTVWPVLTEESYDLFARFTTQFVRSQNE